MNFSENTNLLPGGQSASPSKVKELENKIDDLQQTVTSVADSVADLADEVTTAELNATSANVTNAVIDNATVGTETVTTVNATTANADTLNATDADITNLTADDVEANSVDADNGYFTSVNAQSFTGSGVNITGDITASNKVQGKTVQATEKVVTPALESTTTELKGTTTVRGDVYFPETGDKIYGEYLEVEADKVKADIESDSVNATSVTAGTVTATGVASQGLLVMGNSRFMGEVQARNIVPEAGQTLDITTDTLDADSIEADTVKVNSLITETPVDTNFLVGYDENGELIPVDASLDPSNLWEFNPDDTTTIRPKDSRSVSVEALIADEAELTNASATDFAAEAITAEDVAITGTLEVADSVEVGGDTTLQNVTTEDATINGDVTVAGDATLKATEVDGDLTVNGDIIQNGSAYETHAEKVYSKNDLIITRDGAVSGLSTGQYTGIQAEKYDGTNDGQLVFDKDGEARVGDVGDTEPLMTRDELANMTTGRPLTWDGTNKKAVCGSAAQANALNSGITSTLVTKLNGIATGAEVNVQADWNTTDTTADSYIKNKPTIPATWGTAAEKNAGSAAGNVPLIGTALGTTNNNIVVTNTSGQLKPSGTVIGSAAGKTAGNANGNVPLLAAALTLGNLVQMGSGGLVNSYNVESFRKISNGGAVCSTAKATTAKEVILPGVTSVYTGMVVKVLFTNGNSAASPTIKIMQSSGSTIGTYNIKVVKAGSKVTPVNHTGYWRGATSTSSEMWQPYTTLELMYDGTDWVIVGNPVVESYEDGAGNGYTVYADGKIEQWGYYNASTTLSTIDGLSNCAYFLVTFTNKPAMTQSFSEAINSNDLYYGEFVRAVTGAYYRIPRISKYQSWHAIGY